MPACWRPARRFRFDPAPHSCLGASPTGLSPSRLLTLALRWPYGLTAAPFLTRMAVPPLAPGERPRALVQPAVLRRHLPRTDEAVADRADHTDHERIDEIVMQGVERPVE